MKRSPVRIVGVTAALLACGALLGALAAVITGIVAFGTTEGLEMALDPEVLTLLGVFGALLGGVLLPAACWTLLRRVPLGLAFVGTLLGTVVGGVLGWMLPFHEPSIGGLGGAVLGFLLATIVLRVRFSASRAAGDRPIARPAAGA
ncbi:MAG TPA: hypothetical protein VFS20_04655 [Longimicrobium sp.]|nr:hypothetical protein [Longimicrobium sp.]